MGQVPCIYVLLREPWEMHSGTVSFYTWDGINQVSHTGISWASAQGCSFCMSACMCPLTIWKAVNACPLDLSEGPQLLKAPTLPWSAGQCYLYLLISHRYNASSTDWLGVRHQQQWMVCSGPVTGRVGGKREGMTRLYFPSVLLSHRKPNQVGRQSQQNMIRIEEAWVIVPRGKIRAEAPTMLTVETSY